MHVGTCVVWIHISSMVMERRKNPSTLLFLRNCHDYIFGHLWVNAAPNLRKACTVQCHILMASAISRTFNSRLTNTISWIFSHGCLLSVAVKHKVNTGACSKFERSQICLNDSPSIRLWLLDLLKSTYSKNTFFIPRNGNHLTLLKMERPSEQNNPTTVSRRVSNRGTHFWDRFSLTTLHSICMLHILWRCLQPPLSQTVL